MLLDADRDEREGYLLLYAVALVVEKLDDILALNRLDFYSRRRGNIDALFYKVLTADTGGLVLRGVAESAADNGGHTAERGVDEQLRPADAHEVILNLDGAHLLKQRLNLHEFVVLLTVHSAKTEAHAVGLARELRHTLAVERCTPCDGAAHRSVLANDLGDRELRESVLKRADDAVVGHILLKLL